MFVITCLKHISKEAQCPTKANKMKTSIKLAGGDGCSDAPKSCSRWMMFPDALFFSAHWLLSRDVELTVQADREGGTSPIQLGQQGVNRRFKADFFSLKGPKEANPSVNISRTKEHPR